MSKRGDTGTFDALKRQRMDELDRLIKMPGMPPADVKNLRKQQRVVRGVKDMRTLRRMPRMKEGGAVPAEFKGFSKLPEPVQVKMNPDLAQKYENGGEVRGARSAISGRGFKGIR